MYVGGLRVKIGHAKIAICKLVSSIQAQEGLLRAVGASGNREQ